MSAFFIAIVGTCGTETVSLQNSLVPRMWEGSNKRHRELHACVPNLVRREGTATAKTWVSVLPPEDTGRKDVIGHDTCQRQAICHLKNNFPRHFFPSKQKFFFLLHHLTTRWSWCQHNCQWNDNRRNTSYWFFDIKSKINTPWSNRLTTSVCLCVFAVRTRKDAVYETKYIHRSVYPVKTVGKQEKRHTKSHAQILCRSNAGKAARVTFPSSTRRERAGKSVMRQEKCTFSRVYERTLRPKCQTLNSHQNFPIGVFAPVSQDQSTTVIFQDHTMTK